MHDKVFVMNNFAAKVTVNSSGVAHLQALQGVHLVGGLNMPLLCRMIQGFYSSHERAHWSQGVVSHPNVSVFTDKAKL